MRNKRLSNVWRLCLMTLFADELNLAFGAIPQAQKWHYRIINMYVGRGWAGDLLELIDTQDAEIKTLWQAINKKDEQIDRLVIISEELINKNAQLNNKLKKAKQIGIGVFAGVSHVGEPVIGVGLVWRLW